MERLRVGIVGLGGMGNVHSDSWRENPRADIIAMCDIKPEKCDEYIKRTHIEDQGIKVYVDYKEMIEKEQLDVVDIATPNDMHSVIAVYALEHGINVFCEKPDAINAAEQKKMKDASEKNGKLLMIGFVRRFGNDCALLKDFIDNDQFGEIYYAESDYLKDFQEYHPLFPNIGGWRQKTYFGRRGHPYITHTIGPLLHIMNEKVTKVSCMASGRAFDMPADSTCALMLETEKKHLIRLRASFVSPRPDNVTYYSFQGTKGCYQGPQGPTDFHKIHIRGLCRPNEWRNVYDFRGFLPKEWDIFPENHFDDTKDNGTEKFDIGAPLLLEAFANCIINNTEPPVSAARALNWTAAGLLSEASVNGGGIPVEVPDFGL